MTENGHKQTARRTPIQPSPEPADAGERKVADKPVSKKKKDPLSTFDTAKKALLDTLWKTVPRKLRFPLVALIVIGGGLLATQSYWYPTFDAWLHPPAQRFVVGGRVLVEREKGFPNSDVQLLNRKQEVVSNATTDGEGYITFNLSTEDKITNLRCQDQNGNWTSVVFEPKIASAKKSFRVLLNQKKVEYDEK